MSAGRAPRVAAFSGGGRRAGPISRIKWAPSGDRGWSSARASRSAAERPARSDAAAIEPAEVPTRMAAFRGSQPVATCSALSMPAWNAPPVTPPAPRTNPIRRGGSVTRPVSQVIPANHGGDDEFAVHTTLTRAEPTGYAPPTDSGHAVPERRVADDRARGCAEARRSAQRRPGSQARRRGATARGGSRRSGHHHSRARCRGGLDVHRRRRKGSGARRYPNDRRERTGCCRG